MKGKCIEEFQAHDMRMKKKIGGYELIKKFMQLLKNLL
jgi:hypothetical protein